MSNNKARGLKSIMTTLVIPLIVIGLILHVLTKKDSDSKSIRLEESEKISSIYINESNNLSKVRYKYILGHEASSLEVLKNLDLNKPLFTITSDNEIVAEEYASLEQKESSIPIVSDTITVNSEDTLEREFIISYRDDIEDVKYNIRFEVKIITEELLEGKWTPVYQVVFMERGPYWSLDKGPIERLE